VHGRIGDAEIFRHRRLPQGIVELLQRLLNEIQGSAGRRCGIERIGERIAAGEPRSLQIVGDRQARLRQQDFPHLEIGR
jgi:hypothetical protein